MEETHSILQSQNMTVRCMAHDGTDSLSVSCLTQEWRMSLVGLGSQHGLKKMGIQILKTGLWIEPFVSEKVVEPRNKFKLPHVYSITNRFSSTN